MGSKVLGMKRKPALRAVQKPVHRPQKMKSISILAMRLNELMANTPGKNSDAKLAAYLKNTSARTVNNIRKERHDPFEALDDIASAFHLQPWTLICPIESSEIRDILSVYGDTSEQGRELIRLAVETAKKLRGD